MKIAFLTPEYPHPNTGKSGGLGTSIFNLAKGLVKIGHQVSILVYQQHTDTVFTEDGITVYQIKNVKVKGFSLFLTQRKVQRLINTLYAENKIEIVEAPDWTGFTAFVKPKCPLVIRLNGSDTYFCHLDQRPVKPKNKFLEKRALQQANGIISVSQFTAEVTKQLFNLKNKITIIPNSIDISKFHNNTMEIENNSILYFGTLIRKKGALELPLIFNEVIKINPEAKLILIGKDSGDKQSGSASTWKLMQPLFSEAALHNVDYKGLVPYSEIGHYITKATVCVFPTFAEALPVSWIEAMALKKPIVASNIGWANEVIDDGTNGFLVHPKEHTSFAEKINELLKNQQLQKSFGEAARKTAEQKFAMEVVAKQSEVFYRKFL
ncbi:glycosyltransferase family 4 protein [Aequorivita echinoideorum]|uniref:Glycosyltransferase family 4 protein n=1 Tax=Aequorivita echinoideorum TaxID=1549647 RepID=A0ABS5S7Q8_9FLAO|nr:glycosyltransferase family 4 protein [Aequorivita echinoideorum]MBT0608460.1 glycosyltransferase family 4 protein [Aequorivita echinoideorum]